MYTLSVLSTSVLHILPSPTPHLHLLARVKKYGLSEQFCLTPTHPPKSSFSPTFTVSFNTSSHHLARTSLIPLTLIASTNISVYQVKHDFQAHKQSTIFLFPHLLVHLFINLKHMLFMLPSPFLNHV
jgi:hypothetical protein